MTDINVSPYQYEIVSCKIETDRKTATYEVAASVAELVLYEHIDKPYISGNLVILDDANLFENIDFLGTEKVYIKLRVPSSDNYIRKTFYIREVESAVNTNDQAQMLVLSIIDLDYYLSSLINLQKKYDGTPAQIIKSILADNMFWKNILMRDEPIQSAIRFIVPNMTPFGAMQVLKDRSTDDMGSPFYLFASVTDDKLRFFSLREMLDRRALNADYSPYKYNQRTAQDDQAPPGYAAFNITNWNYSNNENLHKLIMNGDVGAIYEYHDPVSNLTASYKHSVDAIYSKLFATSSVIAQAPTYDAISKLTNKAMHEFNSKVISNVVTSRTFEDINNLVEDNSPAFHREKSVSKTMKNFLLKSSIDITVPGLNFLTSEHHMTTGNIINVESLKNYVPDGNNTNVIDKKKSGNYMIYAARHSFSGPRYEVTLTCGKLSNITGTTAGSIPTVMPSGPR
tara:strand:- start:4808 stop:6169 length:1362 start_codon:yes stop_codon:yes gene_type:complete